MANTLQPWQDFLREENRVLLEQLGDRRIRLTEDQRRRLAVAGKAVGRKALLDLAGLVTPDTILAWHRKLVAAWAGSAGCHEGDREARRPLRHREPELGLST